MQERLRNCDKVKARSRSLYDISKKKAAAAAMYKLQPEKQTHKAYYVAHKEGRKASESVKAYYIAHKKEKNASDRDYSNCVAHKEEKKTSVKAYYIAHKEEKNAADRAYYSANILEKRRMWLIGEPIASGVARKCLMVGHAQNNGSIARAKFPSWRGLVACFP